MDKINQEINNISIGTNNKFQAVNGNDNGSVDNINSNNNNQNLCNSNTNNKEISSKTEIEVNKANICDHSRKCDNCNQTKPSDITKDGTNNNFNDFKTVSFKTPEQLDIIVEKDSKQACCLIYNNDCIIF